VDVGEGSGSGTADTEQEAALESCGPDSNGVISIDAHHLPSIVGVELFEPDIAERLTIGVAMGLSVSAVGGQLLFIEATRTFGKGRLTITGQLGKVMLESVETAMSLLRGRFTRGGDGFSAAVEDSKDLTSVYPSNVIEGGGSGSSSDLDAAKSTKDPFKEEDIHVHFPAGGIPKDGPSAGVAVFLALSSLLLGRPMRSDTAVTGEVSLRGHILPVGGIRDKVLAAHRAGVRHVLIPMANKRHALEDVPAKVLESMKIHYLKHVDEAFEWAFEKPTSARQEGPPDVAEQWATTTDLPPGVPAATAAAIGDKKGIVCLPPRARL
jgi:ATP-dependent Lon protease